VVSRNRLALIVVMGTAILLSSITFLLPSMSTGDRETAPALILKTALSLYRERNTNDPQSLLELDSFLREITRCNPTITAAPENQYHIVISCERRCFKLDVLYRANEHGHMENFHVKDTEDFVPSRFRRCQ